MEVTGGNGNSRNKQQLARCKASYMHKVNGHRLEDYRASSSAARRAAQPQQWSKERYIHNAQHADELNVLGNSMDGQERHLRVTLPSCKGWEKNLEQNWEQNEEKQKRR